MKKIANKGTYALIMSTHEYNVLNMILTEAEYSYTIKGLGILAKDTREFKEKLDK